MSPWLFNRYTDGEVREGKEGVALRMNGEDQERETSQLLISRLTQRSGVVR